MLGREVVVLADGPYPPGNHLVNFHAQGLAAGVYYYQLKATGEPRETRKMILLR
jgi:hypothetical protein